MDKQSKIIVSIIAGLAIGAVFGILFLSANDDGIDKLSTANTQYGAGNTEDDWSDLNDSLGG